MFLPENNSYASGEVALFDTLVRIGEQNAAITLPFQLHLFLVDCLVEHLFDKDITHHILAIGLLSSTEKFGAEGTALLKRTGDEALILAGLFPERARRLNVSRTYFRHMGQSAYASLSVRLQATGKSERGKFYDAVAEHFQLLEKVLGSARAQSDTEQTAFMRFCSKLQ